MHMTGLFINHLLSMNYAFVITKITIFSGPVASALAEKVGYRAVGVSGALLASAAILASSWSPNLNTMIALYGALGGTGIFF